MGDRHTAAPGRAGPPDRPIDVPESEHGPEPPHLGLPQVRRALTERFAHPAPFCSRSSAVRLGVGDTPSIEQILPVPDTRTWCPARIRTRPVLGGTPLAFRREGSSQSTTAATESCLHTIPITGGPRSNLPSIRRDGSRSWAR